MVKLVAMDIDGTLLDSNKNLSEENKKTVNTTPNKEQTSKTDNKLVQKK